MKRFYLLLLLLFPLATMYKSSNVFATDPPESEYLAAMSAIKDGTYYLVTEVEDTKWYVTQSGGLTDKEENAYLFAISKDSGTSANCKLYDTAFLIDPGNGAHFSNATPLLDGNAYLHLGFFYQDSGNNRNDWERQVLYLKGGKFAIRTSNTPYGETSWLDAGRVFWSWETGETEGSIIPCYSYEPAYIWTLELSSSPISFEDANVKAICVANWDTNGDGELSYAEAAAVTSIPYDCFKNNTDIYTFTELRYFINLAYIYLNAFYGCSNLASISIPDGVTFIDGYAFYGCSSLISINIPSGVTTIEEYTFKDCSSLTSVNIPSGITSIGEMAFSGCSSLSSINIPDGVTSIGEAAFWNCSSLTSITIPDKVSSIGMAVFANCYSLESINIPVGVTSIGGCAFQNCCGLTSITIPNSVTNIGNLAFVGCSGLTFIKVGMPHPVSISENTFGSYCGEAILYVPIGCKAEYQTADYWKDFKEIIDMGQSIAFEDDAVKAICVSNWDTNGDGELSYAEAAAVTDLGEAFRENTVITSFNELQYFTGLDYISNNAFNWCLDLTSITIPSSVTTIGECAFSSCSALTSITIPSSVTSICDRAFSGCI